MSGANKPQQMTFDPTPMAVRPMQQMLVQALMGQMRGGPAQGVPMQGLPQAGQIFQQLYGSGQIPPPPVPPGTAAPAPPTVGSPGSADTKKKWLALGGAVPSGSRMMYSNVGSMPTLAAAREQRRY